MYGLWMYGSRSTDVQSYGITYVLCMHGGHMDYGRIDYGRTDYGRTGYVHMVWDLWMISDVQITD